MCMLTSSCIILFLALFVILYTGIESHKLSPAFIYLPNIYAGVFVVWLLTNCSDCDIALARDQDEYLAESVLVISDKNNIGSDVPGRCPCVGSPSISTTTRIRAMPI